MALAQLCLMAATYYYESIIAVVTADSIGFHEKAVKVYHQKFIFAFYLFFCFRCLE